MHSASQSKRSTVPARPLFSDAPAEPGVYRSLHMVRNRWVFYALGLENMFLNCRYPRLDELDEDVIAELEDLVEPELRPRTLALVNADTIIAAGLDPVFQRPFSLPRLVR